MKRSNYLRRNQQQEEIEDFDDEEDDNTTRFSISHAPQPLQPPPQQQHIATSTFQQQVHQEDNDDDFFAVLDADALIALDAKLNKSASLDFQLPQPPQQNTVSNFFNFPQQPKQQSAAATQKPQRTQTRQQQNQYSFPNDPSLGVSTTTTSELQKKGKTITTTTTAAAAAQQQISRKFPEIEFDPQPEIDPEAIKTWIYPVNYEKREYQFNIVREALFQNTLVCLPTGLGKTFIAAVVMYNYFRWFPSGKILFIAPTRPLVAQQIEACHNIVGIPTEYQCELTGSTNAEDRVLLWGEKRIFFLTPQIIVNDIEHKICPAAAIRCIVFDEAHKAQKRHAYCQVLNAVANCTRHFRVLALSASPGSNMAAIQDVVTNLMISKIEARLETDNDVAPYLHTKNIEVINVKLDDTLNAVKKQIEKILRIPIDKLVTMGFYYERNLDKGSAFKLMKARDSARTRKNIDPNTMASAEYNFAMAQTLYRPHQLLSSHGLVPFLNALKLIEKEAPASNTKYRKDLIQMKDWKDCIEMAQSAIDGIGTSIGHPKINLLKEILQKHFSEKGEEGTGTRVMIFTQYRESVQEISDQLKGMKDIKAACFVGQSTGRSGNGIKQKDQLKIIEKFRNGEINVLVATIIGEEGLDIGEVDLIICFDAQTSPTRLIQRMGRTGRKRDGRVVVLACEGEELHSFERSTEKAKALQRAVLFNPSIKLYQDSPRILPEGITPQLEENMFSDIPDGIKDAHLNQRNRSKKKSTLLTEQQRSDLIDSFGGEIPYPYTITPEVMANFQPEITPTFNVGHSTTTLLLIDSLRNLKDRATAPANQDPFQMFITQDIIGSSSSIQQKTSIPQPNTNEPNSIDLVQAKASNINSKSTATATTTSKPTTKSKGKKEKNEKNKTKSKSKNKSEIEEEDGKHHHHHHHKHHHKHKHKHHHKNKDKKRDRSSSPENEKKKDKKKATSKKSVKKQEEPPKKKQNTSFDQPTSATTTAIIPQPKPKKDSILSPEENARLASKFNEFLCDPQPMIAAITKTTTNATTTTTPVIPNNEPITRSAINISPTFNTIVVSQNVIPSIPQKENKPIIVQQKQQIPQPQPNQNQNPIPISNGTPPLNLTSGNQANNGDSAPKHERISDGLAGEKNSPCCKNPAHPDELFPISQFFDNNEDSNDAPNFSVTVPPPPPIDDFLQTQKQKQIISISITDPPKPSQTTKQSTPNQNQEHSKQTPFSSPTKPISHKKLNRLKRVGEVQPTTTKKEDGNELITAADSQSPLNQNQTSFADEEAEVEGFASSDEEEENEEKEEDLPDFICDEIQYISDKEDDELMEDEKSEKSSKKTADRAYYLQSLSSQQTIRPPEFSTPKRLCPNKFKLANLKQENESSTKTIELKPLPFIIANMEIGSVLRELTSIRVIVSPFEFECSAVFGSASVPSCLIRLQQIRHSQQEEVNTLIEKCEKLKLKYARVLLILERTSGVDSFHWDKRLKSIKGIRVLETSGQPETIKLIETTVTNNKVPITLPQLSSEFLTSKKDSIFCLVDEVPKLTFLTSVSLLSDFGNLQDICDSTVEGIQERSHISTDVAIQVFDYLHPDISLSD